MNKTQAQAAKAKAQPVVVTAATPGEALEALVTAGSPLQWKDPSDGKLSHGWSNGRVLMAWSMAAKTQAEEQAAKAEERAVAAEAARDAAKRGTVGTATASVDPASGRLALTTVHSVGTGDKLSFARHCKHLAGSKSFAQGFRAMAGNATTLSKGHDYYAERGKDKEPTGVILQSDWDALGGLAIPPHATAEEVRELLDYAEACAELISTVPVPSYLSGYSPKFDASHKSKRAGNWAKQRKEWEQQEARNETIAASLAEQQEAPAPSAQSSRFEQTPATPAPLDPSQLTQEQQLQLFAALQQSGSLPQPVGADLPSDDE